MSSSNSGAVVHRNVAVIACDTAVTLKETLHRLEDLEVEAVQIGDRHLALPASHAAQILERLQSHGQFPKLIGSVQSDRPAEPVLADADAEQPEEGA